MGDFTTATYRVAVTLAVILLQTNSHADTLANTTILVKSGDEAGGNGQYSSFFAPSINNANNIVFGARLAQTNNEQNDDTGIYKASLALTAGPSSYTVSEIVREGNGIDIDGVVYTPDDLFFPYSSGYLSENISLSTFPAGGELANFALELPVTGNESGGFSILVAQYGASSGNNLHLVAEAGAELDSGDGKFRNINAFSLAGFANQSVTFFSALSNTADGSADNTALFRYLSTNPNNIIQLVRKGDASGAGVFTHIAAFHSNNVGDLVFHGTEEPEASALFQLNAGAPISTRRVSTGDSAPTTNDDSVYYKQLSEPRINNHKQIGFTALLADNNGFAVSDNSGIYLMQTNGTINEVVRSGQLTADGAEFLDFESSFTSDVPRPAFNDSAQFGFKVRVLDAGGAQRLAVFRASLDERIEIARQGDSYEDGTFIYFEHPALNNQGMMAVQAQLQTPEQVEKILIFSDGRDYATVARQGQKLQGKTLQTITFSHGNYDTADGTGNSGLNDSNVVVYKARYEDDSQSINAWKPPLGWRNADNNPTHWDDSDNWFFGQLPDAQSDIEFNQAENLHIIGPTQDTLLHTLTIGSGTGEIRLELGSGVLEASSSIQLAAQTVLVGEGTLAGAVTVPGMMRIAENGRITLRNDVQNDGVIQLSDNAIVIIEGRYSGNGQFSGPDGVVNFKGLLDPGNSPHLLSINGDMQLADSSHTRMEINGSERGAEYDAVDIGGTATLDGKLEIVLGDNLSLKQGDHFQLLIADNLQGEFASVELPDLQDLNLRLEQTEDRVELKVEARTSNTSSSGGSSSISLLLMLALLTMLRLNLGAAAFFMLRNQPSKPQNH